VTGLQYVLSTKARQGQDARNGPTALQTMGAMTHHQKA
jgi:hypothetical protein